MNKIKAFGKFALFLFEILLAIIYIKDAVVPILLLLFCYTEELDSIEFIFAVVCLLPFLYVIYNVIKDTKRDIKSFIKTFTKEKEN